METYRGIVRPSQLDHMGHMNVQYYTAKFDEATWHLFSTLGVTNTYIRENNRGMAAVLQTTNYKAEAMAGDLLVCSSKLLEVTQKSIRFMHYMHNAETGVLLATTELTGVHLDRVLRKSCPLPDAIRTACQDMIDATPSGS